MTKRELEDLRGTRFMAKGFPYKGGNMVTHMIGASVFGHYMDTDATLWVLASWPDAPE